MLKVFSRHKRTQTAESFGGCSKDYPENGGKRKKRKGHLSEGSSAVTKRKVREPRTGEVE